MSNDQVELIDAFCREQSFGRPSGLEAMESWVGGLIGLVLADGIILHLTGIATGQLQTVWIPRSIGLLLLFPCVLIDGWFMCSILILLYRREHPLGPMLAQRQPRLPRALQFVQAAWWATHVGLFIIFALWLHQVSQRPNLRKPVTWETQVLFVVLVFGATFAANLYAMLVVSSFSRHPPTLLLAWRFRWALDVVLTATVLVAWHT